MNKKFTLILLVISLGFAACRKNTSGSNSRCSDLIGAVEANDVERVKTVVGKYIANLPSDRYTEDNFNKLAQSLSGGCGIQAQSLCYSCIYTYPEMSEMKLTFKDNSHIILDIGPVSSSNYTMHVKAVHE